MKYDERGVLQHNRTDIFWSKSTYSLEIIISSFQRLLCRFKFLNSAILSYIRKPVAWGLRSYLQVANNSTSRFIYFGSPSYQVTPVGSALSLQAPYNTPVTNLIPNRLNSNFAPGQSECWLWLISKRLTLEIFTISVLIWKLFKYKRKKKYTRKNRK